MLNFGQIKKRVEDRVGEEIPASVLGDMIDEAQIEIAQLFGKQVEYWYPDLVTHLSADINATATELTVDAIFGLPYPEGVIRLGVGVEEELIAYRNRSGLSLTELERGYNGQARPWLMGTEVRLAPIAGIEYLLPEDHLATTEIRDSNNLPSFKYHITGSGKISFFLDGSFKLIYSKVPDPIDYNDLDAVPEVHGAFHVHIVKYCVARKWEDQDEGIPNEQSKAAMMLMGVRRSIEEVAKTLKRRTTQQYEIGIEMWDS